MRLNTTAQEGWGTLPPKTRSTRLHKLADAISKEAGSFTTLNNRPGPVAATETAALIDLIRFYAGAARTLTTQASGNYIVAHHSHINLLPIGPVAAVLPANYPVLMLGWRTIPALAAGCITFTKPSPRNTKPAERFGELATQTLGDNIAQTVTGDNQTTINLVAHPAIQGVAFTGSRTVGQEIHRATFGKTVSLEMGGNTPVIVFPDAPADTINRILEANIYNDGESCAAPARIIYVGGPSDSWPVAFQTAAARRGCDLTIDPPLKSDLLQVEQFNTTLTLQHAPDANAAILLANDPPQRLAASVWTNTHLNVDNTIPHLNVGEVWVNCHLQQTPELPHSGRGVSGWGIDQSADAIKTWLRPQVVTRRQN